MTSKARQEHTALLVSLVLLLGGLFLLFWWSPLIGDDWYREMLGAGIHSPLDLLRLLVREWSTINARVLGNVLAYTAGSRPLVREVMRTLLTLALILLLSRFTGLVCWRGVLLCAAACLALPQEMFCQIYPWAAGFFNYLPPVALLLGALLLARPVLEGRPLEERPGKGLALFLLGFAQQLFVENNTLCALWVSFALLAWYWWERRKLSPMLLAFCLGCVLGAALMFLSPSYGLIGGEGGAYQLGSGGTLSGLIATAKVNFHEVARYYITKCPVLYWLITLLLLVLWRQRGRSGGDAALAAAVALGCLGLAWGGFKPAAVAGVWGLACTAALWRWTPDRETRGAALFLWVSAAVAAAPLLFVNPMGPRCLFLSYVLLLGTAGVLLASQDLGAAPDLLRNLIPALLAAGVLCFYLSVFLPFHQLEQLRAQVLEQAIAAGQTQAVLPAYEHRGFLWDADSGYKMELCYYRKSPGDLTITFLPQAEWEALYG